MDKNIIELDKYRSKTHRPPIVNSQEEADIYIKELTEEFSSLIKNASEGGEKNGRTKKSVRKSK